MTPGKRLSNALSLILVFLVWPTSGSAVPVEGLSPPQATAIQGAAKRNDIGAMYALIFSVLSQKPEETPKVVSEAIKLVPEHRNAILSTVSAAFPDRAAGLAALKEEPSTAGTRSIDVSWPMSHVGDAALEAAKAASWRWEKKQRLWYGEGQLGVSHNSGNTKNNAVQAAAKLVWTPERWENALSASYSLYDDRGRTTERRFVTSARPRYNLNDRVFAWAGVRFVDDKNDGFQWVLTEAIGPGYRFLDRKDLQLTVSAGPGMQQTRRRQDDGGNLDNEVVGVGIIDFDWRFVENATFSNSFSISSGQERTRVDNLSGLTLKIFGDLAARLSYEVRYDSSPGDGKKETDTTGLASVVYSFEANCPDEPICLLSRPNLDAKPI